ncbi:transcription initiation factor TFIID subunit 3-like [Actinia tenebrosa]|uniref:Transcription initiation factor TFIID subunit 3-like n=1 Tax=Actinia tenebrosa TaxID=6105 RepID=A0A6P8J3U8_ACTTE|nr:transcription initiation factor TFIID subunit 3-like [Actinia tenebrosa]
MSDELNNGALRLAVAQICQSMGWDALHKSTHDLLTDVLQKYMQEIAKCAYGYSQLYCHTEPNLEDLGLAFNDTGVLVHELEDFVSQVDQVPFSYQLPRFPMPKPNVLHHPHKEEIVDRPEFYHEHLPPLIKALQQNEDEGERDAAEIQGLEHSSDSTKSYLRSEIKTVGQETENQLTENGEDKRTANPSVEFESEAKRRRLESPFNKQNKENKLDILQVLQEKNSQSPSPSPSPDFVAIEPDDKRNENTVFTFTSTPNPPSPKTLSSTKKKSSKKTENPSKDKLLLGSPELMNKKHAQTTPGITISPKKTSAKSKAKPKPTASPVKGKNVSPKKTPVKPSPKKKSKPQEKSLKSTAYTPKVLSPASKKKSKPVKKEATPFSPPLPLPVLPHKEDTDVARIVTQTMPKLIIKPLKHEKNQLSEYSVSEMPLEASVLNPEKKKGVKRKATTEKDALRENEPKPKKKKKKKVLPGIIDSTALESQPKGSFPAASVSSTQMLSDMQGASMVMDTIKKKKKKRKEKDRDKSKQKKVKEATSSEFSISSSSATPIPTIKLKLENPSSTSTISTDAGPKLSEITASKKSHPLPFHSVPSQPVNPQPVPHTITQETFDSIVPTTSATTGPLLAKTKEEVPRTVITETLSTTVQIYYCPTCGLADDGSFMIGCDSCDRWYHGACVGINDDPGGDWYCEVCTGKKTKKKKKKKSKDKDKHN